MPDNSFSEKILPEVPLEPPPVQPETISSCSVTGFLGEETNSHL